MVTLYVDGKKIGTLAEAEPLIPDLLANHQRIEFRDNAGNPIGTLNPTTQLPPGEPLVPWDRTITREELERRAASEGPWHTIDEVRKQLGWSLRMPSFGSGRLSQGFPKPQLDWRTQPLPTAKPFGWIRSCGAIRTRWENPGGDRIASDTAIRSESGMWWTTMR
jgi:hypothetical protein